jgi:hypothetical protein
VRAGCWALRAVKVGTYHRIGVQDLISILSADARVSTKIVKETLTAARKTQWEVNDKVSAVKMAHLFLIRAIITFSLLIAAQAVAELAHVFGLRATLSPDEQQVARTGQQGPRGEQGPIGPKATPVLKDHPERLGPLEREDRRARQVYECVSCLGSARRTAPALWPARPTK